MVVGKTNTPEFGLRPDHRAARIRPDAQPVGTRPHARADRAAARPRRSPPGMVPVAHAGDGGGSIRIAGRALRALRAQAVARARVARARHRRGVGWARRAPRRDAHRARQRRGARRARRSDARRPLHRAPARATRSSTRSVATRAACASGCAPPRRASSCRSTRSASPRSRAPARLLESLGHTVEPVGGPGPRCRRARRRVRVGDGRERRVRDEPPRRDRRAAAHGGRRRAAHVGAVPDGTRHHGRAVRRGDGRRAPVHTRGGRMVAIRLRPPAHADGGRAPAVARRPREHARRPDATVHAGAAVRARSPSRANVTGQPAMSVPLHWTADDVPVGVQLVADQYREDVLFRVAAQLEAVQPWSTRRPRMSA